MSEKGVYCPYHVQHLEASEEARETEEAIVGTANGEPPSLYLGKSRFDSGTHNTVVFYVKFSTHFKPYV